MRAHQSQRRRPPAEPRGPAPGRPSEHPLLSLQRAVGNRAAASARSALPASHRGERVEVEAERIAGAALSRRSAPPAAGRDAHRAHGGGGAEGRTLPPALRREMEPRFGEGLGDVRIHTGARAATLARRHGAAAFAAGEDIVFGAGRWAPGSAPGRRLLAHELAHVVQHRRHPLSPPRVLRTPEEDAAADAERERALTAPLTDREWSLVESWLAHGEIALDPLTDDAAANAERMAESIFCMRLLVAPDPRTGAEDPLLCVLPEVTRADPRVRALRTEVESRGAIVHWPAVAGDVRMLHVMERLVDVYNYPVNGAAGLVGNLWSESGVLPSRVEGSQRQTPLRAANFAGQTVDFTPQEVMDRDLAARSGPRRPGIGLAQWTSANRRAGLFQHVYGTRPAGTRILFDMDAQVDYLDTELQNRYAGVYATITAPGVSVDDATDEVVYRFEVPGSVLENGALLPRADPRVQAVFGGRRQNARRALAAYRAAHP